MTSPAREIRIVCRRCGATYSSTSYRPTINVTTEAWSEEEIRDATTATCPECGLVSRLTSLIIDGGEFRIVHGS